MQQYAFVKNIDNDIAEISIYRSSACGEGCGQNCTICGTAKPITAYAKNSVNAKIGDRVVIESSSATILSLSFAMYIIPLIFMICGYFIGANLGLNENNSAISAVIGLLIGFLPSIFINKRMKKRAYITYTIIAVDNNFN